MVMNTFMKSFFYSNEFWYAFLAKNTSLRDNKVHDIESPFFLTIYNPITPRPKCKYVFSKIKEEEEL